MSIDPPTGDEQPRKYYAGAYLDEVDALKAAIDNATATMTPLDISEFHPLTIAAVAPQLLTPEQADSLKDALPADTTAGGTFVPPDTTTYEAANGDENTVVEQAQTNDNSMSPQDLRNAESEPKSEETPASVAPSEGPVAPSETVDANPSQDDDTKINASDNAAPAEDDKSQETNIEAEDTNPDDDVIAPAPVGNDAPVENGTPTEDGSPEHPFDLTAE